MARGGPGLYQQPAASVQPRMGAPVALYAQCKATSDSGSLAHCHDRLGMPRVGCCADGCGCACTAGVQGATVAIMMGSWAAMIMEDKQQKAAAEAAAGQQSALAAASK